MVQLSHPYMTTGKTLALTRWTFVGKVMSLLFNMLPSLVITFLPKSKRLLISWLQSPSAVILEPPSICHEVMGPDAMILVLWKLSSECWVLSQLFQSPLSLSSRKQSHKSGVICISRGYWYFSWQSWFQLVLHPSWHFTWCTLHRS